MKSSQTLVVAPYSGIQSTIEEIIQEHNLKNIHTVVGDLEAGLEVALNEIKKGHYDLIISRGGTANLLIKETTIPILEIPITTTDIMQALKATEKYEGDCAIIGFNSIISKARDVCKLMNWSPQIFTINDKDEVKALVDMLKQNGCSLIIGDVITTNYCKEVGQNSILITSSKDSLETALQQSVHLKHSLNTSKQLYKTCFEHHKSAQEFCLIYNHTGSLSVSSLLLNDIPQYILDFVEKKKTMFYVSDHLQQEFRNNLDLITLTSKQIIIEQKKYMLVVVKINNLYSLNISGFKLYDKELLIELYGAANLNFFKENRASILQTLNSKYPILIRGDAYTGKTSCVNYLFSMGPYNKSLLYVFDLSNLTLDTFNQLSTQIAFTKLANCALCFLNLQDAEPNLLRAINSIITTDNFHNNMQVFFTYTTKDMEFTHSIQNIEILSHLDKYAVISLEPLIKRKADFHNLLAIYINTFNMSLGKNIIGLTDEAFKLLESYSWPSNIKQFKRVLQRTMRHTDDYYITEEVLQEALQEESKYGYSTTHSLVLENSITLDEIIFDVVNRTLEATDYNQTKTAEKLGISRTTVWRILKGNK